MNRLAKEKSPYLLQHARNPVDWYPWCGEAFEKAAREDKPVFVSVGYSTCHWCHVMEKESFEDAQVARRMNDFFVSVKVDREERPDIDGALMSVCQMISQGNCGWPLNVVMTADKRPFFAATYIPKNQKFGRTGMMELLPRINEIWKNRRADIEKSAEEITRAITAAQAAIQSEGTMSEPQMLQNGFRALSEKFDAAFGGFGQQPKFPSPHNLLFLLRYWRRTGEKRALAMTEKTLRKMTEGAINDRIGGGFHRYSTDRRWRVPHFEKMLCDQAMMSMALTEFWQASKNPAAREAAEQTLGYVMREMTSPEGAFFSAEDADSEGTEGKFYVWSEENFSRRLSDDERKIATEAFGVSSAGNFADEVSGKITGDNILFAARETAELCRRFKISEKRAASLLESARKKLFAEREKRPRPYKDDKILTDWNGLMTAAFAKAARIFGEEKYLRAAKRAADFITQKMLGKSGLLHRFRDGEAAIEANLDDCAFAVWGLLELYEAEFETRRLEDARRLSEEMTALFSDEGKGGFFFTRADAENLIVRKKEFHDGAVPCGNSVAAMNLLRISKITGDPKFQRTAQEIFRAMSLSVEKIPLSHTMLLAAMELAVGQSTEVVIAGNDGDEIATINRAIAENFRPNTTVLLKKPGDKKLEQLAPFTAECKPIDGKTAVYVCKNRACALPVTAAEFLASLKEN